MNNTLVFDGGDVKELDAPFDFFLDNFPDSVWVIRYESRDAYACYAVDDRESGKQVHGLACLGNENMANLFVERVKNAPGDSSIQQLSLDQALDLAKERIKANARIECLILVDVMNSGTDAEKSKVMYIR